MKGICLWFSVKKSFGFIRGDDGKDYFIHYSKIIGAPGEFRLLEQFQVVDFEPMPVDREGITKLQAKDVKTIPEGSQDYEDVRKIFDSVIRRHVDRPKVGKVF